MIRYITIVSFMFVAGCVSSDYAHTLEAENANLKQGHELDASRISELQAELSKQANSCQAAMQSMREMEATSVAYAEEMCGSKKPSLSEMLRQEAK